MEKDLNDKLKQEKLSYFRSKEYRGEQLKVIMDAIDYGIGTDYLQLFDDTAIPAGIMKNMLTAMKEDYGVQEAAFLSAVRQEESGRILLEALKSGVPLPELQAAYRDGMFPIELPGKDTSPHAGEGSHTGKNRGKDGIHYGSGKGAEREFFKAEQLHRGFEESHGR